MDRISRSRSEISMGLSSGILGLILKSVTKKSVTCPGLKMVTEDNIKIVMTQRIPVPILRIEETPVKNAEHFGKIEFMLTNNF